MHAKPAPAPPALSRVPFVPLVLILLLVLGLLTATAGQAFCGFYVAKADTQLFNQASKVVLVRDDDRTVLTMANDFQGAPEEFAVVIPVPTFLQREQIHVANRSLLDHLDAYSAPRLVEYFDGNPCALREQRKRLFDDLRAMAPAAEAAEEQRSLGVTVEASYDVGEYDILILSARESDGLVTWLKSNGYRLPDGAEPVVASYLKQGMRFFVARVDLEQQAELGFTYLRPLQIAFESRKFMLPIRLGTVNARGEQELFVFALTRRGRVETTNYRTVRLPTGMELPTYLKEGSEFGEFYQQMFAEQTREHHGRAVFLEYAWDMAWCDPCAADPLSQEQLRELGVFWLDPRAAGSQAQNVFLTRLHVRYDGERFPEDLHFQQTGDRSNFQGRYVLRHPWTGDLSCAGGDSYRAQVRERQEREAQQLAALTGQEVADIRRRMRLDGPSAQPAKAEEVPWWQRLWGR